VAKGIRGTDKEFCNALTVKYCQASVKDRAFVNQAIFCQQVRLQSLLGHARAAFSGGLCAVIFLGGLNGL
jgi:hypothetical protein